jgi:hypothetical protein
MMGRHVREVWEFLSKTDPGNQQLNKYVAMTEHVGWPVHQNMLATLKGLILKDMIGKRFTDLDPVEKDITQRAYVGVIEILDFLHDPHTKARSQTAIAKHNLKMGATVTGATNKGA